METEKFKVVAVATVIFAPSLTRIRNVLANAEYHNVRIFCNAHSLRNHLARLVFGDEGLVVVSPKRNRTVAQTAALGVGDGNLVVISKSLDAVIHRHTRRKRLSRVASVVEGLGVGTDYSDALHLVGIQRKNAVVFEQHHSLAGGFAGEVEMLLALVDFHKGRDVNGIVLVKQAEPQLQDEEVTECAVNLFFADAAFLHRLLQHLERAVASDDVDFDARFECKFSRLAVVGRKVVDVIHTVDGVLV